jgi:GT2 family glycosyltransferase
MGADMFFDSILFRQTGGFDENIFLYGEEGEWQYRLSKEGVRRYILPYPKIIHLGGQTTDELPHINAIQWQSHFYVLKKHMCLPTYILARFYYTLRHTLHK